MGNLKQVETKSLSLLSSLTNEGKFIYPIAVKVTETGGECRSEIIHAYNKQQMLCIITDIAQAILESDCILDLKVSRLNSDLLPTDAHIRACLN